MGREEIIEYLKSHKGKWFTTTELSRNIGINRRSVIKSIKPLRETEEVKYKKQLVDGCYKIFYSL